MTPKINLSYVDQLIALTSRFIQGELEHQEYCLQYLAISKYDPTVGYPDDLYQMKAELFNAVESYDPDPLIRDAGYTDEATLMHHCKEVLPQLKAVVERYRKQGH